MKEQYRLKIGEDSIRFTSDGKISVLDAIKTLSASEEPESVWELLKDKNPSLEKVCQAHTFNEKRFVLVVDLIGWRKIEAALADYVYEKALCDQKGPALASAHR